MGQPQPVVELIVPLNLVWATALLHLQPVNLVPAALKASLNEFGPDVKPFYHKKINMQLRVIWISYVVCMKWLKISWQTLNAEQAQHEHPQSDDKSGMTLCLHFCECQDDPHQKEY